jgi:hypothetical protein
MSTVRHLVRRHSAAKVSHQLFEFRNNGKIKGEDAGIIVGGIRIKLASRVTGIMNPKNAIVSMNCKKAPGDVFIRQLHSNGVKSE